MGVALVAGAAKGLCSKVCPDKLTTGICVICAVVAFCYSTAWLFPVLIACGGLITLYTKRHDEMKVKDVNESIDHLGLGIAGGAALIGFWAALLVLVVVLVDQIDYADAPGLHWCVLPGTEPAVLPSAPRTWAPRGNLDRVPPPPLILVPH